MSDKTEGLDERELIRVELIKAAIALAPTVILLAYYVNKTWWDHQAWRLKQYVNRKKMADEKALQQVQKEISLMEHGEF